MAAARPPLDTGRQLGGAIDLAILLGIAARDTTAPPAEAAMRVAAVDEIGSALVVGTALLGLGAVMTATVLRAHRRPDADA